jgi:hypothetical protein
MPYRYFFEKIEVNVITDERLEMMDQKLKEMEKIKQYIDKILNNPTVLKELNVIDYNLI